MIYYDQRGCGKSDMATSYVWQDHVADLNRLIHTLAKDQKVFLAGSSWGSVLAILYTYTHPEDIKGLILSGTIPWEGEEKIYTRDSIIGKIPIKVLKGSIGELGIVSRQSKDGLVHQDTVPISKKFETTTGLPQYEPSLSMISGPKAERLKQIVVPIIIFNGTKSIQFDWVTEYSKLFSNVEVITIADAGHDPWLRDPNLFFSISNEFIRGLSK